jgi:Bifunctional DNA primase/polymerase, N-terminal
MTPRAAISSLEAALEYAANGWPVYPIAVAGRASLRSKKDNGRRWGCTKDPVAVRADFARWPSAGVAIVTGSSSDLAVIDIDRKNGKDGFAWPEIAKLPATLSATTPHGGRHDYFLLGGVNVRSCDLASGVELKAENASITATPTRGYRWLNRGPITVLPAWLIDLTRERRTISERAVAAIRRPEDIEAYYRSHYGEAALDSEMGSLANTSAGGRNAALNRASFCMYQLVAGGELGGDEVRRRLIEACRVNGLIADDGFPNVMTTIESGMRAGLQQPRSRSRWRR